MITINCKAKSMKMTINREDELYKSVPNLIL
jgi:hypothetical protein